jgi:hypothetical protein
LQGLRLGQRNVDVINTREPYLVSDTWEERRWQAARTGWCAVPYLPSTLAPCSPVLVSKRQRLPTLWPGNFTLGKVFPDVLVVSNNDNTSIISFMSLIDDITHVIN